MRILHFAIFIAISFTFPTQSNDRPRKLSESITKFFSEKETSLSSTPSDIVEKKMDGQYGVNLPGDSRAPKGYGPYVKADFLYMRAKNESLAYASQNTSKVSFGGPAGLANAINQTKIIRPSRHWRPGFRLTVGWDTPFDSWELFSSWSYYHNKDITNHNAPGVALDNILLNNNEGLFPYWMASARQTGANNFGAAVKLQNLQGKWQLNYNSIKLEVGRVLYLTKALSIKPHLGLQNSWIHQKLKVRYGQGFQASLLDPSSLNQSTESNGRANFWGIGICTGVDSCWSLGKGFNLITKLSGALLSGRTNARRIDSATTQGKEFFRVGNNRDKIDQIVPEVETTLGISWGRSFRKDTRFLNLSISWETIFWWEQFKFLKTKFNNPSNFVRQWNKYPTASETLIIEGVSAAAGLDF